MNLGILMSLYNQRYFRDKLSMLCEFIPQVSHHHSPSPPPALPLLTAASTAYFLQGFRVCLQDASHPARCGSGCSEG